MATTASPVLPAELAALDDRFVLAQTAVTIGERELSLVRPRTAEDLISEAEFDADERLPYWADLWPSSIALARSLAELSPRPVRALELGCGLGLVTAAALLAGHEVLATDYYADALLFTRRNAVNLAGREPETLLADWRRWPGHAGRFDLILASDVLYERAYAGQVARTIADSITPDGVAFVADPGRAAMAAFVTAATECGLCVSTRLRVPHDDGAIHQVITIHELRASA